MKHYLLLETPRIARLGYRILASKGCLVDGKLTDTASRACSQNAGADRVVVSHTVKQLGQSGITAREGVERLILVSPRLRSVDADLRDRVRKCMSGLLRSDLEALLADPDVHFLARDRIHLEHAKLNEWLQRLEDIMQDGAGLTQSAPTTPERQQPHPPSPGEPKARSGSQPPRQSIPPMRFQPRKRRVPPLVLAAMLLVAVIGLGRYIYNKRTDANGTTQSAYKQQYGWLEEYGITPPETKDEEDKITRLLEECYAALRSLIDNEDLAKRMEPRIDPIAKWYKGLRVSAQEEPEATFTVINHALDTLIEALRKSPVYRAYVEDIENNSQFVVKFARDYNHDGRLNRLLEDFKFAHNEDDEGLLFAFLMRVKGLYHWKEG